MTGWTLADMPPQAGKTAIVTGATSGVGLEAARALAKAGATVFVAARNPQKAAAVVDQIRGESEGASATFEQLDLGSLASVAAFAERMSDRLSSVDILLNNAGLMMIPKRQETDDGFERQFGTNHLGHFALTRALWPLLLASGAARVVTVSSLAHRRGRLNFDDINAGHGYRPIRAYAQSKLANLMFALELHRRTETAGANVMSVAVHPGVTATGLYATGQESGREGRRPRLRTRVGNWVFKMIATRAEQGALPLVYGVVADEIVGGGYYGPDGKNESRGWPAVANISGHALDRDDAKRLWSLSEELTGAPFDVRATA